MVSGPTPVGNVFAYKNHTYNQACQPLAANSRMDCAAYIGLFGSRRSRTKPGSMPDMSRRPIKRLASVTLEALRHRWSSTRQIQPNARGTNK